MTTAYSNLLGLALPVTGELSGTWGDTVNDYITKYLDDAIANAQVISGSQTAVTLSKTTGTALVAAGSGSTGSAQYALIRCTGNPASTLTITVSYASLTNSQFSKTYLIFNSTSTNQSVVVQATTSSGTSTGVTITAGERALIAWNGTDFVKIATQSGTGEFVTVDTTNLEVTNIKAKDGTAAATIADSTGAITVSTLLNVDNLRLDGNTLSSTDSNGNVVLAPNGTGDVQLDADTVRIGDSNANATITTNGTGDLILNTNSGTNSGSITIEDGVNGNIIIAPNGTGQVQISNAALDLTTIEVTNIKAKDGTASITLADSTGVATFSANPILNAGTANGVVYLNASKVLTTGSALTFDGNRLTVSSATPSIRLDDTNTSGSFGIDWFYSSAGVARANITLFDSGELQIHSGASGSSGYYQTFFLNGAERMRLTSTGTLNIVGAGTAGSTQAISFNGSTPVDTLVTDSSGRVGIGTSSPQAKLHVAGAAVDVNCFIYNNSAITNSGYGATIWLCQGTGIFDSTARNWGVQNLLTGSSTANLAFQYFNGTTYTQLMTLDSSGNLGLGVTPSAWLNTRAFNIGGFGAVSCDTATTGVLSLSYNAYAEGASTWKYKVDGVSGLYQQTDAHKWFNAASGTAGNAISFTQAMTLDASGNLVIGTTSALARLHVTTGEALVALIATSRASGGYTQFNLGANGATTGYLGSSGQISTTGGTNDISLRAENNLLFNAGGNTERARITSGGYFKASNAGTYASSTGTYHELRSSTSDARTAIVANTASSLPFGILVDYTGAAPNGTGSAFLECQDTGGTRFVARSNGGLANYQSNNVDLSDARTKTDISPLGSYWNKIAGLEIVTYKYKDQTHDDLNIGVIAQQVEAVAPEFVDTDGFGDTPEDAVPLKTIYNKDLTFAAIKALQEAMARIETLEAKIAVLESKGV